MARTVTFTNPDGTEKTVTFRRKSRKKSGRKLSTYHKFMSRNVKALIARGHEPRVAVKMAVQKWQKRKKGSRKLSLASLFK